MINKLIIKSFPNLKKKSSNKSAYKKILAYVALTKPRIIELLLITTVPTMIFANKGIPNLWLIFVTLIGGALAAGSANSFNCYIDKDIDKLMNRTERRPLVTGELSDKEAWYFSWILGISAAIFLVYFVNVLAALLAVAAILFYVIIYTMWLKRRTPQNIVWGGAAGCMPVLIAWAAVTNSVSWEALVLFGVIFFWTPPHYWPLSLRYKEDYAKADVPMLPVLYSSKVVSVQVLLYTWAMFACSLLLIPVGKAGWFYTVVALTAGIWFLCESYRLYKFANSNNLDNKKVMKVFHVSITYLTILFISVGIDPLVGL